jgi:hypothetical protein
MGFNFFHEVFSEKKRNIEFQSVFFKNNCGKKIEINQIQGQPLNFLRNFRANKETK